jgi:hypothetical protein
MKRKNNTNQKNSNANKDTGKFKMKEYLEI